MRVCVTFGLGLLGLQLQSATLLETNAAAAQQLLEGGAERWVDRLRRVDGQEQNQNPEVLMGRGGVSEGCVRQVCVCVRSYSVQLAAALAKLRPLGGGGLRLQADLVVQQVGHQNINQVGAAGGGENLDLPHTGNRMIQEQMLVKTGFDPLISHLVQEAGEEGVGGVVVEERPLVHQDHLDVLAEHRVLTQQLHAGFSQDGLKRPHTLRVINDQSVSKDQSIIKANTHLRLAELRPQFRKQSQVKRKSFIRYQHT